MKKILAALGVVVGCGAACVAGYFLYKRLSKEVSDFFEDQMLNMANSNGSYDYAEDNEA